MRTLTHKEWLAEAVAKFGPDAMAWAFECPVCHHVATVADWKASGAGEGAIAFSCVGRWIPGSKDAFAQGGKGPCTYAGGGLFKLNPVSVVTDDGKPPHDVFEFAAPSTADADGVYGTKRTNNEGKESR